MNSSKNGGNVDKDLLARQIYLYINYHGAKENYEKLGFGIPFFDKEKIAQDIVTSVTEPFHSLSEAEIRRAIDGKPARKFHEDYEIADLANYMNGRNFVSADSVRNFLLKQEGNSYYILRKVYCFIGDGCRVIVSDRGIEEELEAVLR